MNAVFVGDKIRGISLASSGDPIIPMQISAPYLELRREAVATKRLLERAAPGQLWASNWPWVCHPSGEQLPRRPAHCRFFLKLRGCLGPMSFCCSEVDLELMLCPDSSRNEGKRLAKAAPFSHDNKQARLRTQTNTNTNPTGTESHATD